jgi:hypothetical protein
MIFHNPGPGIIPCCPPPLGNQETKKIGPSNIAQGRVWSRAVVAQPIHAAQSSEHGGRKNATISITISHPAFVEPYQTGSRNGARDEQSHRKLARDGIFPRLDTPRNLPVD